MTRTWMTLADYVLVAGGLTAFLFFLWALWVVQ